jgi:hypothetical protein
MTESTNFSHIIAVHGLISKKSESLYLVKDDGEEVLLSSDSLRSILEQSVGTRLILSGKCIKTDGGIVLNVDHYEKLKSAA